MMFNATTVHGMEATYLLGPRVRTVYSWVPFRSGSPEEKTGEVNRAKLPWRGTKVISQSNADPHGPSWLLGLGENPPMYSILAPRSEKTLLSRTFRLPDGFGEVSGFWMTSEAVTVVGSADAGSPVHEFAPLDIDWLTADECV